MGSFYGVQRTRSMPDHCHLTRYPEIEKVQAGQAEQITPHSMRPADVSVFFPHRRRGSNASSSASPIKLISTTISTSTAKVVRESHQASTLPLA